MVLPPEVYLCNPARFHSTYKAGTCEQGTLQASGTPISPGRPRDHHWQTVVYGLRNSWNRLWWGWGAQGTTILHLGACATNFYEDVILGLILISLGPLYFAVQSPGLRTKLLQCAEQSALDSQQFYFRLSKSSARKPHMLFKAGLSSLLSTANYYSHHYSGETPWGKLHVTHKSCYRWCS